MFILGLTINAGIGDFFKESAKGNCKGKSLLMLGRQLVYMDSVHVFLMAERMNITLKKGIAVKDDARSSNRFIEPESFFQLLGFEQVDSMDISPYEGANILFDLNSDELPEKLHRQYDYILDGGTLEHIFQVPNALHNIVLMLKSSGKIFHYLPASGWINHGYYTFSPSLFNDFYRNEQFFIEDLQIVLENRDLIAQGILPRNIEDCLSTNLDCRMLNLSDQHFSLLKDYYGLIKCIAQKPEHMQKTCIPIQRHWYKGQDEYFHALMNRWNLYNYPDQSIMVWGCGKVAKQFYTKFREKEKIKGFLIGDSTSLIGKSFEGLTIFDYRQIKKLSVKAIVIASINYEEEIIKQVQEIDVRALGIQVIRLKKYLR